MAHSHYESHLAVFKNDVICECLVDFPGSTAGKESAYNAGDLGSILGLGRSPRGGHGYPLQFSCLENSMDRGI